jgi:hypothetical protein
MKIKVEIDLKPEELQRFLGIPDVVGLQEDLIRFLREKVASDPAGFVIENLGQLKRSRAVRRILYGAGSGEGQRPARRSRREPEES